MPIKYRQLLPVFKHTALTSLNLGHNDTTSLDYTNHLQQIMLVPSLALRRFRCRRRFPINLYRCGFFALATRPFAADLRLLGLCNQAFFDAQLDYQALRGDKQAIPAFPTTRTSRLLNISSSRNSETPNLRELASAKATPTIRVVPPFASTSLMAMTSGDDRLSMLLNKRSSSCCRFPGEAYPQRVSSTRVDVRCIHTSFPSCHFDAFL